MAQQSTAGIVLGVVVAIVVAIVGLGAATIAGGLVNYILAQLNSTGVQISSQYNILKPTMPMWQTIGTLLAVTVLVIIAAVMIWILWDRVIEPMRQKGGSETV